MSQQSVFFMRTFRERKVWPKTLDFIGQAVSFAGADVMERSFFGMKAKLVSLCGADACFASLDGTEGVETLVLIGADCEGVEGLPEGVVPHRTILRTAADLKTALEHERLTSDVQALIQQDLERAKEKLESLSQITETSLLAGGPESIYDEALASRVKDVNRALELLKNPPLLEACGEPQRVR